MMDALFLPLILPRNQIGGEAITRINQKYQSQMTPSQLCRPYYR
tara:strand:+ start:2252 stop:2383 length:132 start_codon:yes stop_codon:yes gene_type:complete